MKKLIPFLLASLPLAGCTTLAEDGRSFLPETSSLAVIPAKTQTQHLLADIPPPSRPVAIAVYGFSDQTRQFKPSETGQTPSLPVSQRRASLLVKSLTDSDNTHWSTCVVPKLPPLLRTEQQLMLDIRG